jgi:hypothetical protein
MTSRRGRCSKATARSPAARLGAPSRGKVHDVADGPIVEASLEADRAKGGEALRDQLPQRLLDFNLQ